MKIAILFPERASVGRRSLGREVSAVMAFDFEVKCACVCVRRKCPYINICI